MDISCNNLCRLALLIVFIIAIFLIVNYLNKPTIIETNYEHLNPALLTHQYEDLAANPSSNRNINFYIKDKNRYSTNTKYNPKLIDPLITNPGLACAPKNDWSVYQGAGANNTYGDMVWNITSPRMVLTDNCFNCKNNNNKRSSSYNEPLGISSSLTSEHEGTLNNF